MADYLNNSPQKEDQALLDILKTRNLLAEGEFQSVTAQAKRKKQTVFNYLLATKAVKEEDLVKARGEAVNIPYTELYGKMVRGEVLNIIPQELAQNYQMAAFHKEGNILQVAMVNPVDYRALEAVEFIGRKNQLQIKHFICSTGGLHYILRQYESLSKEVEEALKTAEKGAIDVEKIEIAEKGLEEVIRKAPVSKMVSVILRHAVEGNASDVHIEPVGNETRVRYRIDGILHTSIVLPKEVHSAIVARIKVLSNLKIDETRIPQDGRFRMTIDTRDIDYRVSTLPLINKEKVVMRILDTSQSVFDLADLGFWGRNYDVMKNNIAKSHGMFLATGPTGSGKSTSLYALLTILNKEAVNIVTLEDPVEYYLKGVSQSQINPEVGLTFAAGLRSILRQDPDIIMVGEIRDNETAELAVHASLTGHVVLSTLHTNDAFGAVPRLIDMKIEPFLVTSSVNVIIAQRLVRRVCPHCKEEYKLPEKSEKEVLAEIEKIPKQSLPKDTILAPPLKFFRGKGCVRCENMGYKGRTAIAEVLEMTDDLKKIIQSGSNLDSIKEEFRHQGLMTMKQDGLIKALQGLTSIEEVWNATRE
ncbi:MAG: GspE/PulE family protein [Patescibacteria group bacterium]